MRLAVDEARQRLLDVAWADRQGMIVASQRIERSLTEHAGHVRKGQSLGFDGYLVEVDVLAKRYVDNTQERAACFQLGKTEFDVNLEAAGAKQSRVDKVFSIGGADDHDITAPSEAVEFGQ